MKKWFNFKPKLFLAGLFLILINQDCQALSAQDFQLLQKDNQLYQAWVISRNYWFGTSLKKDPVKALAWQMVYVSQLPRTYPGKEKLLQFFQENMSSKDIAEAQNVAGQLRTEYDLKEPFTETQLLRAFSLREKTRKPLPDNRETGVVGRILPWPGITKANLMLQHYLSENDIPQDPWHIVTIPLTISNEGEFYAIGLTPGRYKLFINVENISAYKIFSVRLGEIKGLSLIKLKTFHQEV